MKTFSEHECDQVRAFVEKHIGAVRTEDGLWLVGDGAKQIGEVLQDILEGKMARYALLKSLRDEFATHVPEIVIDAPILDNICENLKITRTRARAYLAYEWADAMLVERERDR